MAQVPDHLVPEDGLTDASVRFSGFDTIDGEAGIEARFDFTNEDGDRVGTFTVFVDPQESETIDAMVADAHRQMRDVLRGWLYEIDLLHSRYSKR